MNSGYFKILEITPTTNLDVIKSAYKRLANKYHPDKNPENTFWAEERFKLVSEAYRLILKEIDNLPQEDNSFATVFYDPFVYRAFESNIPNYWDTIRGNDDPRVKVKLILHELENENWPSALELFLSLENEMKGISPLSLIEQKDYFDACFLLAEAFEKKLMFARCVDYYAIYLKHTRILLHRRSFSAELKKKILMIYQKKLCKRKDPAKNIEIYKKLLGSVVFSFKEKAKLYKDLAKWSLELGQNSTAKQYITEAMGFDPKLAGLSKLQDALKKDQDE